MTPAPPANAPAASPTDAPQPRPRRWRRWLVRGLMLVIALRIALALALPWLLNLGASFAGLQLQCRSATLSLTGLSLQLDGVVVRDAQHADRVPLLRCERLAADLATLRLLRGDIEVVDVALTGATVALFRNEDGTWSLPGASSDAVTSTDSAPPEDRGSSAPTPAAATPPTRFALPVAIASARVHDLRLQVHDVAAGPQGAPIETWLLGVGVRDLGFADRTGQIDVRLHDPQRLDHFELTASADLQAQQARLSFALQGKGLRLASPLFAELCAPFANPARVADAQLNGTLQVAVGDRDAAGTEAWQLDGELRGHVDLDGERAGDLHAQLGPCTHAGTSSVAPFWLRCTIPGVVEALAATEGKLELHADGTRISTTLAATGLTLGPVRAWLRERGLQWPPTLNASLRVAADLRPHPDGTALTAGIENLRIGAGDDVITLPKAALQDAVFGPQAVHIGAIEIDGPVAQLVQDRDGSLLVAGLRLRASGSDSAASGDATAEPSPNATDSTPNVRIDRVQWQGLDLRVIDRSFEPAAELHLRDLALQGSTLGYGPDMVPGEVTITAQVPGIVDQFGATLQLTPVRDDTSGRATFAGADLTFTTTNRGIDARGLQPWLQRAGLQIGWRNASLAATAQASVRTKGPATTGSLELSSVRLQDGDKLLLALDRAALAQFTSDADGFVPGAIDLLALQAHIERRRDGVLDVAGLEFAGAAPPFARQWLMGLDAHVEPMPGGDYRFDATLRLAGALDAARCDGTLRNDERERELRAQVAVTGIDGSGFDDLLPPSLRCVLEDGSFAAQVAVKLAADGDALQLDLTDLALRDGERALLSATTVRAHLPTLRSERVHLETFEVLGLRADVEIVPQEASGPALQVAGLRFLPPQPTDPQPTDPQPTDPQPTVRETADPAGQAQAPDAPQPTPQTQPEPQPAAATLPALRIDQFVIEVAELRCHDRTQPDATAITTALRLALQQPWQTARELPLSEPLAFALTGAAQPLLAELTSQLELQPFTRRPTLMLDLQLRGIDTTAITRVLPSLRDSVQGTSTGSEVHARLDVELDLHRRHAHEFDFARPFGIDLQVSDLRWGEPDAEPFLAMPEAEVLLRSLDLATGTVLVQRVELIEASLQLAQSPQGLQFGGLLLPPAATPAVEGTPASRPASTAAKAGEVVVDRLRVQGLRLDYRDSRTTPATHLPIANLDLDVRGFTTRALREAVPITFALEVQGGDVRLERRVLRSSALAGLVQSAGAAITGASDQHELVNRPLVEDLSVRGQLALWPIPQGELWARISALEMPAFRGLAAPSGVDIADGVLDFTLTADLQGTRGGIVRAQPVFTSLSIAEPPGGPISTYLRLPAPLDTVLFLLRNDAGEHRLPARLALDDHHLDAASIRDAAVEAVALLMGDAIGSTPVRVLQSVTHLLGFGGPSDPRALDTEILFAAGATTPPASDLDAIADMLLAEPERRLVLRHEPSAADREHGTDLATPTPALVRATVADLRRQQRELLAERQPLATALAAELLAGRGSRTLSQQQHLAQLDTRLGELQSTLDGVLQMLERGGQMAAGRRTRQALRDLGEARLRAVRELLRPRLGEATDTLVELRTPRSLPSEGLPAGGRVLLRVR